METVKIYDAKTHFSSLVDRAAAGERIIIAKGDRPVAMLGPIGNELEPREPVTVLIGEVDEIAWKQADKLIESMFADSISDGDC
jgi:antitoxin (DNA-binding transcriptional repressor) of toxin-antitoxin stability system